MNTIRDVFFKIRELQGTSFKLLETRKNNFTYSNLGDIFVVYELDSWSRNLSIKFTRGDCLFGAVNLTKNVHSDKYWYGYGIGYDACLQFLLPNGEWCKNVVIFYVDNSLSLHVDNRKKRYPSSLWRTNKWTRSYF